MTFFNITATTTYKKFVSDDSKHLLITNDGANDIDISLNGTSLIGIIKAGEVIEFLDEFISELHIKTNTGTSAVRLWFFGVVTEAEQEQAVSKQVPLHTRFREIEHL